MDGSSGIRLVAMDLDGTLLDSAKNVPPGFFEAAATLHARGIHVVIASGRQYANILKKFSPAKDDLVIMADNGAFFDIYGERIVSRSFEPEQVERILAAAAVVPTAHPIICCAESAYTAPCSKSTSRDIDLYYERIEISQEGFERARAKPVIKIAIHDETDSMAHLLPTMGFLNGNGICLRISGDVWLDAMPEGVDKGDGIRRLQQLLGVAPEACMAFGDFENDLGMLEACGESYAMANAVPSVKALCRHEAPSNDDDGVMKVLRNVFGLA